MGSWIKSEGRWGGEGRDGMQGWMYLEWMAFSSLRDFLVSFLHFSFFKAFLMNQSRTTVRRLGKGMCM